MPDKLIPGKKKTMAYSKSSGFKMKGYSYPEPPDCQSSLSESLKKWG